MKTGTLLFLGFLFFAGSSCAQSHTVDSLKNELQNTKQDTNYLKLLNSISREFLFKNGNYKQAIQYADSARVFAERVLAENRDAEQIAVIKIELARAIINIGFGYNELGNYPDALKYMFNALKISEEIDYKSGIASCNINIGQVYFMQNNFTEALNYFAVALKMYESIGDKISLSKCYNNIAGIHLYQGNYADALKNLFASLKIREETGDRHGMANSYNNIGEVFAKQGKYAEALKKHFQALIIREEFGDKSGIAMSDNNIGVAYAGLGRYTEAATWLNKGLILALEINDKERIKDIYQSLSDVYNKMHDYKNAFKYHTLYSGIKDTLLNESNVTQMAEMKTRYETEKKEKEIALLNKNNELLNKDKEIQAAKIEKQQNTVKYLIAGFVIVVVFAIIALALYNQKRKTVFKHEVLESKMQALRAQMNPHFTFNVLNSIQYYVRTNDMKSAEMYLNKFSKLIRMILDQSRNSYILLQQEITMLKLYLELEQMLFEKKFDYNIQVDKNLDVAGIFIPGMLIQPIVENAIKHGLEHKEGESMINISFISHNATLLCSVTDNGIGREAAEKLKADNKNSKEGNTHVSAATKILKERMDALSTLYSIHLSYKTEDIINENGAVEGTRVLLEVPINNSPAI